VPDPATVRLLAYEEIRQLAARYAVATDARDLDSLVALFVDDVQVGRWAHGRPALKAFFDQSLRGVGITILNIGTHVIEFVDDDHATGIVYCRGEIQEGTRWIVQAIQYRDTYERRAPAIGLLLRAGRLIARRSGGVGGGDGVGAERHTAAIPLGPRDGHQSRHRNRLGDCHFRVPSHGHIEHFAAGVIECKQLRGIQRHPGSGVDFGTAGIEVQPRFGRPCDDEPSP